MHADDALNVPNGNPMGFQVSPTHGLTNCRSVILIISPWGRHLMYTQWAAARRCQNPMGFGIHHVNDCDFMSRQCKTCVKLSRHVYFSLSFVINEPLQCFDLQLFKIKVLTYFHGKFKLMRNE